MANADKGFAYKDADGLSDGVTKIAATSGPVGRGKLQERAAHSTRKGQGAMPTGIAAALEGASSATLQVRASDALCYGAVLGTARKNEGSLFEARTP
jgi:hypothetical protein